MGRLWSHIIYSTMNSFTVVQANVLLGTVTIVLSVLVLQLKCMYQLQILLQCKPAIFVLSLIKLYALNLSAIIKNFPRLMEYAKILRTENKVRKILGVWL